MSFRGAVISVGGTPEPIIKNLGDVQPHFVLFIVSAASKPAVEQSILPRLAYTPQYTCSVVADEADFGACYEAVRNALPIWLKERGLEPAEIYVDITGGTKPMSAGLAMAGAERFSHFSYVGGRESDKGGLGAVVSGTEESLPTLNPWDELATRERDKATSLFRGYYAEQAEVVLREAAGKCRQKLRVELSNLAELLHLFAEADRFRFNELYPQYRSIQARLNLIFGYGNALHLLKEFDAAAEHWKQLNEERKSAREQVTSTLRELLANAKRRACQGRYDDAVARLYRAGELFVQGRLQEAYGWKLGRPQIEVSASLPPDNRRSLQGEFAPRLGLDQGFRALSYSPKPGHREIAGRYEAIKSHLQKRNDSILAHGFRPASEEDFRHFWEALLPVVDVKEEEIPRWPELEF